VGEWQERVHSYLRLEKTFPTILRKVLQWSPLICFWVLAVHNEEFWFWTALVSFVYLHVILMYFEKSGSKFVLISYYFRFWRFTLRVLERAIEATSIALAFTIFMVVLIGIVGLLYFGWKQVF